MFMFYMCHILWPLLVNGGFPHWQLTKLQYIYNEQHLFLLKNEMFFFSQQCLVIRTVHVHVTVVYSGCVQ